jgi:hypothetical protein
VTSVAAVALLGPVLVLDLAGPAQTRSAPERPAVEVLAGGSAPVEAAMRTSTARAGGVAAVAHVRRRAAATAARAGGARARTYAEAGGVGIREAPNPSGAHHVCLYPDARHYPDLGICQPTPGGPPPLPRRPGTKYVRPNL